MNLFKYRHVNKGPNKHNNAAKKRREVPYSKYKMPAYDHQKVFKIHYAQTAAKQNEFFKENNLDPDLIMKTCIFHKITINELIAGLQRYFAMKIAEENYRYIMDYEDVKLHKTPTVVLTPVENEIRKLRMKNLSKSNEGSKREERSSGKKCSPDNSKQLNTERIEEKNVGIGLVSEKHQIETVFEFCALLTEGNKMDIDGNSSDMFRFLPVQTNLSTTNEEKRADNNNLSKTREESGGNRKIESLVANKRVFENVGSGKKVDGFKPKFKSGVEDVLNTLISSWENMELDESNKSNIAYSDRQDSAGVNLENKKLSMPARQNSPEINGSIPTSVIRNVEKRNVEIIKDWLSGENEKSESIYAKSREHIIPSRSEEKAAEEMGKGKSQLHDEIMNEEGVSVLEELISERENEYISEFDKYFDREMKDAPISVPHEKQDSERILETDKSLSVNKEIEGRIAAFRDSTTQRDKKQISESDKGSVDVMKDERVSVPEISARKQDGECILENDKSQNESREIEGHVSVIVESTTKRDSDNILEFDKCFSELMNERIYEHISETDRSVSEIEKQILASDEKVDISLNDLLSIDFDALNVDDPLEKSEKDKDAPSSKDKDAPNNTTEHQSRSENSSTDKLSSNVYSNNMYYSTLNNLSYSLLVGMKRGIV